MTAGAEAAGRRPYLGTVVPGGKDGRRTGRTGEQQAAQSGSDPPAMDPIRSGFAVARRPARCRQNRPAEHARNRRSGRTGRWGCLASALAKAGPNRAGRVSRADLGRRRTQVRADDGRGVGVVERGRSGEQVKGCGSQRVLVGVAVDLFALSCSGAA